MPNDTLSRLPSARHHRLTGKFNVRKFSKWATSTEACSDGSKEMQITGIDWMKQPGLPSHEYLIVILNGYHEIRVERDTDSWSTLFWSKSWSNCKDTVTVGFDRGSDVTMAWVRFNPGPGLHTLTTLLDIITESADIYNVWTFNCWWLASCIWTNLVSRAVISDSGFDKEMAGLWGKMTGEVEGEWDALKFVKVQQFVHLAGLKRTMGESDGMKELEKVSAHVAELFDERMGAKPAAVERYQEERLLITCRPGTDLKDETCLQSPRLTEIESSLSPITSTGSLHPLGCNPSTDQRPMISFPMPVIGWNENPHSASAMLRDPHQSGLASTAVPSPPWDSDSFHILGVNRFGYSPNPPSCISPVSPLSLPPRPIWAPELSSSPTEISPTLSSDEYPYSVRHGLAVDKTISQSPHPPQPMWAIELSTPPDELAIGPFAERHPHCGRTHPDIVNSDVSSSPPPPPYDSHTMSSAPSFDWKPHYVSNGSPPPRTSQTEWGPQVDPAVKMYEAMWGQPRRDSAW
ncbi:hypothetical protein JAAARDRAFT_73598 [Jaapia argillacea MUCL 33604]|uniref:Uncharacterized protein n=1 Tax=Jaapia argillacea MUCL 33604 TaxID=933084 RepID=A0A067PKD6_9AGAM|nr:hypothetical protein JAAARDRAFT_73598 [Jaapia argillacea MUCL 33604]